MFADPLRLSLVPRCSVCRYCFPTMTTNSKPLSREQNRPARKVSGKSKQSGCVNEKKKKQRRDSLFIIPGLIPTHAIIRENQQLSGRRITSMSCSASMGTKHHTSCECTDQHRDEVSSIHRHHSQHPVWKLAAQRSGSYRI